MMQQRSGINNQYQFNAEISRNSLSISLFCYRICSTGKGKASSYILEPFGIKVILIEPGVTNTKFVQDIVVPTNKYEDDKNGDRINQIDENNKDVQLSYYNDTMKKFLAFYFKAMSIVFYPRVLQMK